MDSTTATHSSPTPALAGAARLLSGQPIGLILLLAAVVAAVAGALIYAKFSHGLIYTVLLKDPNAIAGQPEYYGVVTNIGLIGWMVGASTALYSCLLMRRFGWKSPFWAMLMAGGLLSGFALLDDFFMFHEGLAPRLGIPEYVVMTGYATFGLLWAAFSLRNLLQTEWLLAFMGLGSLAVSVFIDTFIPELRGMVLAEDMAKLLGILLWNAYLVRLSWRALEGVVRGVVARQ